MSDKEAVGIIIFVAIGLLVGLLIGILAATRGNRIYKKFQNPKRLQTHGHYIQNL